MLKSSSGFLGKMGRPQLIVLALLLFSRELLYFFQNRHMYTPDYTTTIANCDISMVSALMKLDPSQATAPTSVDYNTSALLAHEFEQLHADDNSMPEAFRQAVTLWKERYLSQFALAAIHPMRRKVILLGPHDRFNFGDLLFEKVTSKLLRDVAGYKDDGIIVAGMVNRTDMAELHDGPPSIVSIRDAALQSQQATLDGSGGPYHIVYLGGECANTHWVMGMNMFPSELRLQAAKLKVVDCAYMIPKVYLLPPGMRNSNSSTPEGVKQPVAVVNSINHKKSDGRSPCSQAVLQADYVAYRDVSWKERHEHYQARPDSAVMTNFLFHGVIAEAGNEGEVREIRTNFTNGYLVVQMKVRTISALGAANIAATLDDLHSKTGLPTVFFRAGSVPMHDSLESIKSIRSRMKSPSRVFYSERLWQVVALIRYSSAVLSTSLHVRIMSFVHARPRVTFCGSKHKAFATIWDASDATPCVDKLSEVIPSMMKSMNTPPTKTYAAQRRAIHSYLEGFQTYSAILNQ